MNIKPRIPPRSFQVGNKADPVTISDCASIELSPDEQVTFRTEKGAEYDVARKSWGYYATPSLGGRLRSFGLRPALAKNARFYYFDVGVLNALLGSFDPSLDRVGMIFEHLVFNQVRAHCLSQEKQFEAYLASENLRVVCWLDDEAALAQLNPVTGPAA